MSDTTLLEIRGHRLAVRTHHLERTGTPVVFLHGITASVNFWERILPAEFRETRPWISLSLPGHFPSTFPQPFAPIELHPELFADLIAEALKQLGVSERVALVGWSTGGYSALNFAIRYPDLVRRVLSICGFASGPWRGLVGRMSRLTFLGRPGRWLFRNAMTFTWNSDRWYRWSLRQGAANLAAYDGYPQLETQVAAMQADARRHDPHALSWLFRRVPSFDLRPDLGRIGVPTWIVGGERDPFIPLRQTRLLGESIPGARLVVLPECGHMFFAEATQRWHELLGEFAELPE